MDAVTFREKYFDGTFAKDELEIQLEINLIDVPDYPYKGNQMAYVENSGETCTPYITVAPLNLTYGDGWLFGPRENAHPVPSMLAYWFDKIRCLTDFPPIPGSYKTLDGKYFVRHADHRILFAYIMGWDRVPLQIIRKNVQTASYSYQSPAERAKTIKRYNI